MRTERQTTTRRRAGSIARTSAWLALALALVAPGVARAEHPAPGGEERGPRALARARLLALDANAGRLALSPVETAIAPSDRVRNRATAILFGGVVMIGGGGALALPGSFEMMSMTLTNPVALGIGLALIAGGTAITVLGGRQMARARVLAAEEAGATETASRFPGLTRPGPALAGRLRPGGLVVRF